MITGNVDGVSLVHRAALEALYTLEWDEDEFAPPALIHALAPISAALKREIAVYLDRGGAVRRIAVGTADTAPLEAMNLRRSLSRLCGVRCIHTHPGGSAALSDVDLSALKSLKLDAIASLGLVGAQPTGMQAAFLTVNDFGELIPDPTPVYPVHRIPQEAWLERIEESDKQLSQRRQNAADDAPERALLLGIESDASLDELAALADTAGAIVVARVLQRRNKPDNSTYVGSGKAQEIALEAQALDCDLVIVDDELSGAQGRNLEEALSLKVVDRTSLILDIFASRAQSRAGKLQVEMAQLAYQLPRLIGEGVNLSRLGGGIGTRGPGETKLEVTRRRVKRRLYDLRQQVEELSSQRELQRTQRQKGTTPVVALVGYTNTGKSTLLNAFADAGVFCEDKLFATLDPVTRRVPLPDGAAILLTDTVGFIRKLPHALIDAFRSTLEEALCADLLLIINDASAPDWQTQRDVVLTVLHDLGAGDTPILDVFNKADRVDIVPVLPGALPVSATLKQGLDVLLSTIQTVLGKGQRTQTVRIPYTQMGLYAQVRQFGTILSETHTDNGMEVCARLPEERMARLLSALNVGKVNDGD